MVGEGSWEGNGGRGRDFARPIGDSRIDPDVERRE